MRAHSINVVAVSVLGVLGIVRTAHAQDTRASHTVPARRGASEARGRQIPEPPTRDTMDASAVTSNIGAAVHAALAEYRTSGVARSITSVTVTVLPFGRIEPVVTCTVLRACIVELEAGERFSDAPVAGDPVRWSIDSSRTGPGGQTPLVVVKPRACDVTTNLVVPTDRRVYDLTLDSPPCARGSLNPRSAGVRHVRFYYPDDEMRAAAPADASLVCAASVERVGDADPIATLLAERAAGDRPVNAAYRIVRHRRGPFGLFGRKPLDFPWQPSRVVDDGMRTYVALPSGAAPLAAPVFYAVEEDGSRTMVNYAVRSVGDTPVYVADRVVRRAILVVMTGSREQRLELENRAWGRETSASSGDMVETREGQGGR
jgi:type IV secretion system protein VirB9